MIEYVIDFNHKKGYEEFIYVYAKNILDAIKSTVEKQNIKIDDIIKITKSK
jgi:molybdopterin-guanine dinucleotide biosynthesis protein A